MKTIRQLRFAKIVGSTLLLVVSLVLLDGLPASAWAQDPPPRPTVPPTATTEPPPRPTLEPTATTVELPPRPTLEPTATNTPPPSPTPIIFVTNTPLPPATNTPVPSPTPIIFATNTPVPSPTAIPPVTSTPIPNPTATTAAPGNPFPAPPTPTQQPLGRVIGTVIDETTGAPAPSVWVSVGGIIRATDANGNYERGAMWAGTYQVGIVLADGRLSPAPFILVVVPPDTTVTQHLFFRSQPDNAANTSRGEVADQAAAPQPVAPPVAATQVVEPATDQAAAPQPVAPPAAIQVAPRADPAMEQRPVQVKPQAPHADGQAPVVVVEGGTLPPHVNPATAPIVQTLPDTGLAAQSHLWWLTGLAGLCLLVGLQLRRKLTKMV